MTRTKRPSNVPRPELARKTRAANARPAAANSRPAAASHDERPEVIRGPIQPMPGWRWKTFPVYFALALGLFLGVFAGASGQAANDNGNGVAILVIFVIAAILLGAGFSRLTTRYLLARNWARRAPKKD